MPAECFVDVFRWVKVQLGLQNELMGLTDANIEREYSGLPQRKSVLRPLLIQRNILMGLAVPEVRMRSLYTGCSLTYHCLLVPSDGCGRWQAVR